MPDLASGHQERRGDSLDAPGARLAVEVAELVRHTLGDDQLLGAYAHGSAVLGGLRPHSDVDVLAVIRRSMTRAERERLIDGLLWISGSRARRGPARPVELIVVVGGDVRPWRYPPRMDFLYGEWLRDEFERGVVPEPALAPDLAPLLTMVLAGDRPLLGPPPARVLDPVPPDDVVQGCVAGIPDLVDELETDTRNVLLTLVRIWCTVTTGDLRAKDEAADWGLERLPPEHRAVVARARAIYLGLEEDRWEDIGTQVRRTAAAILSEIERVTAATAAR